MPPSAIHRPPRALVRLPRPVACGLQVVHDLGDQIQRRAQPITRKHGRLRGGLLNKAPVAARDDDVAAVRHALVGNLRGERTHQLLMDVTLISDGHVVKRDLPVLGLISDYTPPKVAQ
jgi:hypothetical protein